MNDRLERSHFRGGLRFWAGPRFLTLYLKGVDYFWALLYEISLALHPIIDDCMVGNDIFGKYLLGNKTEPHIFLNIT
jgi:hypothetical protein